MIYAFLVFTSILGAEDAHSPAYKELGQGVLKNRRQVSTLQVRALAHDLLMGRGVRSELYLDVPARRWRMDMTGWVDDRILSTAQWSEKHSGDGTYVYDFEPPVPQRVARIQSWETEVKAKRIFPFPDPRNAGLVPVNNGNSGTAFEITGSRLDLDSYTIECPDADETSVETGQWKGEPSRLAKATCLDGSKRRVFSYIVVPGWGYSVVLVTAEFYRDNQLVPYYKFVAESEVALHDESRIWFPTKVHYQAILDGKKDQEEICEFQVVSLNRPMPAELFTFKGMGLDKGHVVADMTGDLSVKRVWDGERVVLVAGQSCPSTRRNNDK